MSNLNRRLEKLENRRGAGRYKLALVGPAEDGRAVACIDGGRFLCPDPEAAWRECRGRGVTCILDLNFDPREI